MTGVGETAGAAWLGTVGKGPSSRGFERIEPVEGLRFVEGVVDLIEEEGV
jgi:hypothetical protein